MIRIFVNVLPFFLQKSTDIDYARALKESSKALNATFYYPHKRSWGLKENIFLIINKIFSLLKIHKIYNIIHPKRFLNSEFNEQDFDLVYTQGTCVQNAGDIPLFIESGLWMPGQNRTYTFEDAEYFQSKTLPLFEDYLKHKSIINLKSHKEIENAYRFFPQYKERFVLLPFLLPKLVPISIQELYNKHNNDEIIRIGFLGGQAIRKGLPSLLEAYKNVKKEIGNRVQIELHIISGYTDGKITIPRGLNIIEHGRLPYIEAQRIMKTWHIFAMISDMESYGLVYIEAMANGCVNIVRDFFPQKEFVNFGEIGFLAKPNDIISISEKLREAILLDRETRLSMALAGLKKFNEEFEYSNVVKKYEVVLNKCKNLR